MPVTGSMSTSIDYSVHYREYWPHFVVAEPTTVRATPGLVTTPDRKMSTLTSSPSTDIATTPPSMFNTKSKHWRGHAQTHTCLLDILCQYDYIVIFLRWDWVADLCIACAVCVPPCKFNCVFFFQMSTACLRQMLGLLWSLLRYSKLVISVLN